jgi:hypothetical protein
MNKNKNFYPGAMGVDGRLHITVPSINMLNQFETESATLSILPF